MPMLVAACPSFEPAWDAYRADSAYEPGLLYVDLGEVARHVLALWQAGRQEELGAAFAAVERLHLEGDDFVREAATIGFLEDLQHHAEHAGVDPEVFRPYLGPESARWWVALKRFWAGEISSVRVE